jgi:diacylglycerol kinase family enzyme
MRRITAGTMTRTLPVLINRSGGTAAALGDSLGARVEEAFADTGQAIALELVDGDRIEAAVRAHAGESVIAVGGGDGTLGTAAAALAGTRSALAILPLGTRNHLARQLGIPLDLAEAARVCVTGQRRRIDLGGAGDRTFVNNASFGIYVRFVRQRERLAGPKWLSTIPATWHVLRNMRAQHFSLAIDGRESAVATPLLFIGNNQYSLEPGHLGERDNLDDGQLSLLAVAAQGPRQLIGFALRAVAGLARPERDFEELAEAQEIVVEGEGMIEVALDGELVWLPLPLTLRSRPNALGVVTPRETAEADQTLPQAHQSRTL